MQFIDLTTRALDKIDMAGMQRIKLTEYHTDILLLARKLQPEKPVQRLQLLRAGAFNFGIQKLA